MSLRVWFLTTDRFVQTCTECGRSIVPRSLFYRDMVSMHLNKHVDCENWDGHATPDT